MHIKSYDWVVDAPSNTSIDVVEIPGKTSAEAVDFIPGETSTAVVDVTPVKPSAAALDVFPDKNSADAVDVPGNTSVDAVDVPCKMSADVNPSESKYFLLVQLCPYPSIYSFVDMVIALCYFVCIQQSHKRKKI